MQCLNCVHKTVCKHYSYAIEHSHIGITIDDCKLYSPELKNIVTNIPKAPESSMPTSGFKIDDLMPETILLRNSAGYPDFSSLSEATKPINAMPVDINKVTCDRCKKEAFSTDVDNCIECGRPVCTDCKVSTFDPNTGTVTSVCEKCWSGTEDPIPGEEAEISISFEEKEDVWDIQDFIDNNAKEEKEDVSREQVDNRRSNKKSKNK